MAKTKVAILITGSRSLNPAGKEWALGHIKAALVSSDEMDISVLNGGAENSPDQWSTEVAIERGLYVAEWRTDGIRYAGVGMQSIGRWKAPAGSEGKPTPLQRNLAMIEALLAAKKAGYTVGVLALVDPKSPTHGTDHTVSAAKAAGIEVDRREFVTVPTASEIAVAAKKKEAEESMRRAAIAAVGKPPQPSPERQEEITGAIAAEEAGADGAREHLDQLLSDAEFVAEREALDEEVHTGGIPAYSPPQDHLVKAHEAAGLDPAKFGLTPPADPAPAVDPSDVEFDRALQAGIAATASSDEFSTPKAVVFLDDSGVHGAVFERTPRGTATVSEVYTMMRQHSRSIIEPSTEGPKHYGFRARFNPMLVPKSERVDLFNRVVALIISRGYDVTSNDWVSKPGEAPPKPAAAAIATDVLGAEPIPGKRCSVCKGDVFSSKGGLVCKEGHGGAEEDKLAAAPVAPAAPAPEKSETIKQATVRLGPLVLAFLGERVEGGRYEFLMDELRDHLKKATEGNAVPTPDAYKILYGLQKQKALEYEVVDRKKSLYGLTQFHGVALKVAPPTVETPVTEKPAAAPVQTEAPAEAVAAPPMDVPGAAGDDDELKLILRLGELLTGVADGIKGSSSDLVAHDWSNLPELARGLRLENDLLRASIAKIGDVVSTITRSESPA